MPTVNLNRPAIAPGQISAADLDAARQHSTGRIVHLRRVVVLPAGCDGQGKYQTRQWAPFRDTEPTDYSALDDCATEGGKHAEPVPTKTHKDRPGIGIALVLAPWLAGVIGWALYVRWAG